MSLPLNLPRCGKFCEKIDRYKDLQNAKYNTLVYIVELTFGVHHALHYIPA